MAPRSKQKIVIKLLFFIAFFCFFLEACPALAQVSDCEIDCPPGVICIPNPLKWCTLDDFIYAITDFIFWIVSALAPLMIVIGAFYFLTSAGNPLQVAQGKKIILYTLVGYAIILISKGLIFVIKDILSP